MKTMIVIQRFIPFSAEFREWLFELNRKRSEKKTPTPVFDFPIL
jgi:hypothetical protein